MSIPESIMKMIEEDTKDKKVKKLIDKYYYLGKAVALTDLASRVIEKNKIAEEKINNV